VAGNGPLTLSDRVRSLRLPQRPPPRSGASLLPWALVVVFAGTTAFFALNGTPLFGPKDDKAGDGAAQQLAQATPEGQAALKPGDVVAESKGYIVPLHQIQVSPKIGGMVIQLNIEEGMRVAKGFVLARIEDVEYRCDYERSVGLEAAAQQRWLELKNGNRPEEKVQAKAELDEAEANLKQLNLDWKRNLNLKSTPALAARDYELSYFSYMAQEGRVRRLEMSKRLMDIGARDERVAAAKAEYEQARADTIKAKWRLDNCAVLAPVEGTILTKKTEEGSIVNPAAFNIAASICDMADLCDMEVDLAIAERDIAKIFKGQKCEVRAEAFPNRVYPGYVSRLMPTADRGKGAVPVRVKILIRDAKNEKFTLPDDDEGKFLRPDMGAIVRFLNETAPGQAALQPAPARQGQKAP
jgi:multidrug resistance efflux pump